MKARSAPCPGGRGRPLSDGAVILPVDMKIVVSVEDAGAVDRVVEYNPTFIEVRLDRVAGDLPDQVRAIREKTAIPLIATLRSREEGGDFVGDADLWARIIGPITKHVDFVDVEARYRDHAPAIKGQGIQIIASLHTNEMPSLPELGEIEEMLRSYGDIPKIVVKPRTADDPMALVTFTHQVRNPSARVSWAPIPLRPGYPTALRVGVRLLPCRTPTAGTIPHTGDAATGTC